jgi:hypothetical protein
VASANRACWHQPDVFLQPVAECKEGGLDGLLIPDSGIPQAVYSVHRAYADMTGNRVPTASTDPYVTAFATNDPAASTVQVLLGREQSCTPAVRSDCPEFSSPAPPPTDVQLRVNLPRSWPRAATVRVERIPNVTGPLPGPLPVAAVPVTLGPGWVSIPISAFADGDAYVVTVAAA